MRAAVGEVDWCDDDGGGIKCAVGLSGRRALAQSKGIYPCNKLLHGLESNDYINPWLLPGCETQGMAVIFAGVTGKTSGPGTFTKDTLIKVRRY